MCLEDIRLGRKTGVAITNVTLPGGGAVTRILQPSQKRIHLSIWSSDRVVCNIAPDDLAPSATVGIAVASSGSIINTGIEFDIQQHGLLLNRGWRGTATTVTAANLMIVETFLQEE